MELLKKLLFPNLKVHSQTLKKKTGKRERKKKEDFKTYSKGFLHKQLADKEGDRCLHNMYYDEDNLII